MSRIGILAVQGAFLEHEQVLSRLGVPYFELRQKRDLEESMDGLILPGGESTVMGKLLRELELMEPLRSRILAGLPVLGTCAGLILLAKQLAGGETTHLASMDICAVRNAYGRQLGSFAAEQEFGDFGRIPMTFIRAPYISAVSGKTEILRSKYSAVSFWPTSVGRRVGKLLLYLLYFLFFSLLGGIPALLSHLFVKLVLHAEGIVQRCIEGLVYIGGGGFYRAVQKQIANTLLCQKDIFHNAFIIHVFLFLSVRCGILYRPQTTVQRKISIGWTACGGVAAFRHPGGCRSQTRL